LQSILLQSRLRHYRAHNLIIEKMNTIEEGAIVHEKQRHGDVDVEKGKSNGQGSCDAGKLFKHPNSVLRT
jgi:hypothetical protein